MEDLLLSKIESLESKLAFQEITIEELNQMVITLHEESSKLKQKLALLSTKLQTTQVSNIAALAEETPPPHY